jgi:hypothetical protein
MVPNEPKAGVGSWDSMMELFRRGEVLPEGRTNEEEARLVEAGNSKFEIRRKAETRKWFEPRMGKRVYTNSTNWHEGV